MPEKNSTTTLRDVSTNTALPAPNLWTEYAAVRQTNTIVHQLLAGGTHETHRPTSMRRVQLTLVYESASFAHQCADAHASGRVFQIAEPGRPTPPGQPQDLGRPQVAMRYVVAGDIAVTYDAENDTWTVTIDAQEVAA